MYDGRSYGTGNGDWSRPMTVSGTNLESGMGLNAHPSSEADDFSQPLQKLRLQSSWGHLPPNGSARPQNGTEHRQHSSPPSPPVTDDNVDMPTDPALPESGLLQPDTRLNVIAQAQAPAKEELHVKNGESRLPTPVESVEEHLQPEGGLFGDEPAQGASPSVATKRKARDLELFSSGSLSPPPTESIELSSPAVEQNRENDAMDFSTPASAAPDRSTRRTPAASEPASGRRATRANAKNGISSPIPTPTTRGRKSMRLG